MTSAGRPPGAAADPVFAAARLMEQLRDLVLVGTAAPSLESDERLVTPAELAARLHDGAGGRMFLGGAFGGTWPVVESPVGLLIPGIPVVVGRAENPGPDAIYRREGDRVLREAVGEEVAAIRLDSATPAPGAPFALLWFGTAERYVLATTVLVVEDLFAAVRVPASTALLDRLLVRSRRLAGSLPEGLVGGENVFPPEVEVRRAAELLPGDDVFDPVRVLQLRPEVERVRRAGDELIVRRADADPLRFAIHRASATGWQLGLVEGRHPFIGLSLDRVGSSIRYVGTLHPEIDPLAPGVRSRLAFDLQADLVAV